MKKKSLFAIATLAVIITLASINACKVENNNTDYLKEVLSNLEQIKSVTYYSTEVASAPGDTSKFTKPRTTYKKIFINPSDTLVGASSVSYAISDTTKATNIYDGMARGFFNWDKKKITIDSFQYSRAPFRLVYYSLYTKAREILRYSLTTKDSIQTSFDDLGDSIHFQLKIINKHLYFHLRPIEIENDYIPKDDISSFDIWIRKSDNLPYRMKSSWHHSTYFESASNVKINTSKEIRFISSDYFPEDFEIIQFTPEERKLKQSLEGKPAPDWNIKDLSNNIVGLKDFKSKVLMIKFTGVGCGPCHSSLPFLIQLVEDSKEKDFELIAIETWSENIKGLINYRDKNEINFKFLIADEKIEKDYDVNTVPMFFILDENRVIRKIITGYGEGITDKKIKDAINELL